MTLVELNPKFCSGIHLQKEEPREYWNIPEPYLTDKESKMLAESFVELFKAAQIDRKRVKIDYKMTMLMRGFAMKEFDFIVSNEFALAFYNSYKILSESTKRIYTAGVNKGKNLLIGLNDGTHTLSDFDKFKID